MFRKNPEYIFLSLPKEKEKRIPRFFLDGEKFSTEKKDILENLFDLTRSDLE